MDDIHEQNTHNQIIEIVGKNYFYHNITPSKGFKTREQIMKVCL